MMELDSLYQGKQNVLGAHRKAIQTRATLALLRIIIINEAMTDLFNTPIRLIHWLLVFQIKCIMYTMHSSSYCWLTCAGFGTIVIACIYNQEYILFSLQILTCVSQPLLMTAQCYLIVWILTMDLMSAFVLMVHKWMKVEIVQVRARYTLLLDSSE